MDQRARHARVQDVPDDGDAQFVEAALHLADGEAVEQRLGRVRVRTVTGVDEVYVRRQIARDQVGGAAQVVAHHEQVGVHRLEIADRVEHGLALGGAGGRHRDVDHVRRQTLGGDLEGGAGAGAGLEEQIDDGLAAQQRDLFDLALAEADERLGGIEDVGERLAGQSFNGQQVPQPALTIELNVTRQALTSWTLSSSLSGPVSLTCWRRSSLRCAPTTCASMGSSRPSRSISTASVTEAGRP